MPQSTTTDTCAACGNALRPERNVAGLGWCPYCDRWRQLAAAPEARPQPGESRPQVLWEKYGRISTELKELPDDEPLFLFRGQDALAPSVISNYAMLLQAAGLSDQAVKAHEAALEMRRWQERNRGRVKYPD